MKQLFKIIFLFCIISSLNAQSITWQRLYNSSYNAYESGRAICQTSDGNFIIAGLIYPGTSTLAIVLKINPYGDTLWMRIIPDSRILGSYCCTASDDGGCVITGDGVTNFAIHISSEGIIKWTKFYSASNITNNSVKRTPEGGYIFCGTNIDRIGYVTKIDSVGNLLWGKSFTEGYSCNLTSVLNSTDNCYIITGTILDDQIDTSKVLILKLDTDGETVWKKKHVVFNIGGSANAADVIEGGYLIGGTTVDSTLTRDLAFFIKTDTNGNIIYSKSFDPPGIEYFHDIKKGSNNRYIMAVRRNDNAKVYAMDSLGNIIYQKTFPSSFFNAFRSIMP